MIDVLLSNIVEVISAGHIVEHDGPSHLIEKLLLEVLALILHLLKPLCPLRKHVLLGLFVVSSDLVHFFDQCWVLNLPLLVVLLFEQLELVSIQKLSLLLISKLRAHDKEVSFHEAGSALLSLILEL